MARAVSISIVSGGGTDPFVVSSGGLALLVDGAGGRPGGLPPDLSLAPVLTVRFR